MDCPNPKKSAAAAEDGIPEDALVEILSRLPVKPIRRSKCVAKAWRDLIDNPLHGKKLPQTLEGFFVMDGKIYGASRKKKDKISRKKKEKICSCDEGHFGFVNLPARSVPLGIDPCFSFLTKLPGMDTLTFSDSCNGLLLFEHGRNSDPSDRFGYIVCNPATERWVAVPRYGSPPPVYARGETRYTYLVFDPAVSSHFHLIQFWYELRIYVKYEPGTMQEEETTDEETVEEETTEEEEDEETREEVERISVHVYSSETGSWSHIQSDWDEQEEQVEEGQLEGWRQQGLTPCRGPHCAFLNGMLHFIISGQDQIAAVDVQGTTRRIIPVPATTEETEEERWPQRVHGYVAQSQGRLHYINRQSDGQLAVWVLEDYDTQEWVLKHTVSFLKLFGKKCRAVRKNDYRVVAMHPDGNVVFIVQGWNLKLVSCDMDHRLVSVIDTLEDDSSTVHVVPYVPYFGAHK